MNPSRSSVDALKADADRFGWKLDLWPANRMESTAEIRMRVGRVSLWIKGRELEDLADGMLEALGEIGMREELG